MKIHKKIFIYFAYMVVIALPCAQLTASQTAARTQPTSKRTTLFIAGGVAATAVLVVGGVWWLRIKNKPKVAEVATSKTPTTSPAQPVVRSSGEAAVLDNAKDSSFEDPSKPAEQRRFAEGSVMQQTEKQPVDEEKRRADKAEADRVAEARRVQQELDQQKRASEEKSLAEEAKKKAAEAKERQEKRAAEVAKLHTERGEAEKKLFAADSELHATIEDSFKTSNLIKGPPIVILPHIRDAADGIAFPIFAATIHACSVFPYIQKHAMQPFYEAIRNGFIQESNNRAAAYRPHECVDTRATQVFLQEWNRLFSTTVTGNCAECGEERKSLVINGAVNLQSDSEVTWSVDKQIMRDLYLKKCRSCDSTEPKPESVFLVGKPPVIVHITAQGSCFNRLILRLPVDKARSAIYKLRSMILSTPTEQSRFVVVQSPCLVDTWWCIDTYSQTNTRRKLKTTDLYHLLLGMNNPTADMFKDLRVTDLFYEYIDSRYLFVI